MTAPKVIEIQFGPAFWLILVALTLIVGAFFLHALSLADPGNFPEDEPVMQETTYTHEQALV